MFTNKPRVAVVGATGRTGRLILEQGGTSFTFRLVGRNVAKLSALAASIGDDAEWARIDAVEQAPVAAAVEGSAVVINLAGPFTATATAVAQAAMSVGAAYVDIANERQAVQAVLDLSALALRSGVLLAPASGFGTVATEGLAAWLADGEAMRSVELALLPENEGRSPGAFETVLLGLASGGSRVVAGRHRTVLLGTGTRRLQRPDGTGV